MNFYTFNRGLFRRLHQYFSYHSVQHQNRRDIKKRIKKLGCKPLSRARKKEIKEYYASFGFKNINTDWHRLYTHVNGKFYKEYIPEDFLYNVIEPSLNMEIMFPALTDKNLLEKLYQGVKQPETVIRNINGLFVDRENTYIENLQDVILKCKSYKKLVIKPSIDSGGGKNVIVFEVTGEFTDYNGLNLEDIICLYDKNFIIQNYVEQHEEMKLLNPSSLNTIRVITLLINDRIEILSSLVRMGRAGSKIDNIGRGGIFVKISDDGFLEKEGYDDELRVLYETDSKIKFKGLRVPNFNRIKKDVIKLHKQSPHFRLISWDIALDKKGETVLLEHNLKGQGVFPNAGPFFGKFTDQILKTSQKKILSN